MVEGAHILFTRVPAPAAKSPVEPMGVAYIVACRTGLAGLCPYVIVRRQR